MSASMTNQHQVFATIADLFENQVAILPANVQTDLSPSVFTFLNGIASNPTVLSDPTQMVPSVMKLTGAVARICSTLPASNVAGLMGALANVFQATAATTPTPAESRVSFGT